MGHDGPEWPEVAIDVFAIAWTDAPSGPDQGDDSPCVTTPEPAKSTAHVASPLYAE